MKKCIWCSKDESEEILFNNKAHTIPQSLGGTEICENVCDDCNSFFGSSNDRKPPIELVFKEAFNISRVRMLSATNEVGKNKALERFKSIYFNVDFEKSKISVKNQYKFLPNFQETLCRQLKKGIFKVYLEEIERQQKDGNNEQYNFIRAFARYNIGDPPVYYFEKLTALIILGNLDEVRHPKLYLEGKHPYLLQYPGFFEFEFLGHVFGIPTIGMYELTLDAYIRKSIETKRNTPYSLKNVKSIRRFDDIDFTLKAFND